jgi:hypothetical protein
VASRKNNEEAPLARLRELHRRGDVRAARALAWSIQNDPAAPAPDRAEAEAYRARTDVDRRAIGIGLSALALGIFVVVVFILLRH